MNTEEKHIENLLLDYFAGELSETEEKELLLWLEADEANKGKPYKGCCYKRRVNGGKGLGRVAGRSAGSKQV